MQDREPMTTSGEQGRRAPLRRFWFDQPEIHLALFGFLFAFVWEMWQMPFYDMGDVPFQKVTVACTLATFGDTLLMVSAYSVVSLLARCRRWLLKPATWIIAVYLLTGLTVTVLFEELATGAQWGWTYSDRMPFVPGTRIAIVPLLMWVLVPPLALALARRQPL